MDIVREPIEAPQLRDPLVEHDAVKIVVADDNAARVRHCPLDDRVEIFDRHEIDTHSEKPGLERLVRRLSTVFC
jgi:hypothetical protein